MKFIKLTENSFNQDHFVCAEHIARFCEVVEPDVTTVFFKDGSRMDFNISSNDLIKLINE